MRIWFHAFWGKFNKYDNLFVTVLKQKYDVIITPDNPDIIFTDARGFVKPPNCKAIYFSGEPFFDIGTCDYALTSFNVDDPRFFRLPLYTIFAHDLWKAGVIKSYDSIFHKKYSKKTLLERSKLCAYISQGAGGACPREHLINHLQSRTHIDCAGNHLNNHPVIPGEPGTIEGSAEKIKFLKNYKFAFAIENNDRFNEYYGYTTEKIYEPMLAGCIPIYWGNPLINEDFNKDSFLNVKDYESYDALLDHMLQIESNTELYIDYLMQPYVLDNKYFNMDYLVELFDSIVCG